MRATAFLFAVVGTCSAAPHADGPVILPPTASHTASAPTKLMIILPAEGPPSAYVSLAQEIQARSSLRLAVGIVNCHSKLFKYMCDAEYAIFKLIPDAISRANSTVGGTLQPKDVFIGGHAVGGVSARRFVDTAYTQAAGVFTLGTQYNGDADSLLGYLGYPIKAYPRPFFGLSGELDKMPISHVALWMENLKIDPTSDYPTSDSHLQKFPCILPGLDQSSYMSLPYKTDGDLEAEVDRETAQKEVGAILGAWLDFISGVPVPATSPTPEQVLRQSLITTLAIAQPFRDALQADKEWCAASQMAIPGTPSDSDISVQKIGAVHLDSCHTSYKVMPDGKLQLNLCDYTAYNYGHRAPWNPSYAGASTMDCKMIGEDRIAQLLKLPAPDMSSQAVKNRCQSINAAALTKAKELVGKSWQKGLDRFIAQGKSVVFQNDTQTSAGPLWLMKGLHFVESAKEIDISGIALVSSVKSFIYPGNHYCKLLSPSVAVEVVMSMGLTKHVSLQHQAQEAGIFVV